MKKFLLGGVALFALTAHGPAGAADMRAPAYKAPPAPLWSWSGFYIGTHSGLALSHARFDDPFGASIFGDKVRSPGSIAGLQGGYNWQNGNIVTGLEFDTSFLNGDGTNTCLAFSGNFTSANCRVSPTWMGTLTGRLGTTIGYDGRTLLYLKGGLGWVHNDVDVTVNFPGFLTTSTSDTRFGGTIGAGVEYALTGHWTAKFEYAYLGFGKQNVLTPYTLAGNPVSIGVAQDIHAAKVGVNYKLGGGPAPWDGGPAAYGQGPMYTKGPAPMAYGPGWEVEIGGRYWYSSGRFQKDLPGGNVNDQSLISRLTYDNNGSTGEFYGRIDTPIAPLPMLPWTLFVKGNVGAGSITKGKMNDEDWLGAPAYSNTLSDLTKTRLDYATIDVGVDVYRGHGYKVGYFIGYNRWHEQMEANTCVQIASPASGICNPPITNTRVITETDTWDSLRAGISGEVMLTDRVKLSGDAAYLPYVKFRGVDNHWLRNLVIDESGRGKGVQVEGFLSYYLTPQFSIGAGARYWAVWTTSGSDSFNGVPIDRNDTYRAERFGGLFQATYKFGGGPVYAKY